MAQVDDMNAIDHYMKTANANTPAALKVQLDFRNWFTGLSWLETATSDDVYAKARRFRDDFNSANKGLTPAGEVKTAAQKLTIKTGSTGPNVVEWQRIIGVPADGKFGPNTTAKTIEWQRKNGLTADGIVGPASWTKALQKDIFTSVAQTTIAAKEEVKANPAMNKKVPATSLPTSQPAAKSSGSAVLKEGSAGANVANWQKTIGIKSTGTFGPETTAATKAWQAKHGLNPDGVVGSKTLAASTVVPKETGPSIDKAASTAKEAVNQAASAVGNALIAAPNTIFNQLKRTPLWMKVSAGLLGIGFLWGVTKKVK